MQGVARAHEIIDDGTYSAFLHIDPSDEPEAGVESTLNILISNSAASYNQTDYSNTVSIVLKGKTLKKLKVEQAVFGNAADGKAKYTFPSIGVYKIELDGHKIDNPADHFHMSFSTAVNSVGSTSSAAVASKTSKTPYVVLLAVATAIAIGTVVAYSTKQRSQGTK